MKNFFFSSIYTPIIFFSCILLEIFSACSNSKHAAETSNEIPTIFPDYTFVTIPADIAPLNFRVDGATTHKATFLTSSNTELFTITGKDHIEIPIKKWNKITRLLAGDTIKVALSIWNTEHPQGITYQTFPIAISKDPIDPYIAYRLIDPGYEPWHHMGLYQRELKTFKETSFVNNDQKTTKCFNCHTFHKNSPNTFVYHERGDEGGTIIVKNNTIQKINLKSLGNKQQGVYPSWHPNGRWIIFSSNQSLQSFYSQGKKALEGFDNGSDLLLYDTEKQEVLTDKRFNQSMNWETFPTWSPDGKYLYFCTAEPEENIPIKCTNVKYSLVRINFDEKSGIFGEEVDTLYNTNIRLGSVSHPRISANGRYLLYSEAAYGTFPIWHAETDLRIMDLQERKELDTSILNSSETESFHSWSSNGKWILFTSRRMDGRHTRLYIAHFDENGGIGKPFMLPQKNPEDNWTRIRSYNVPDFVTGKITYRYSYKNNY